MKTLPRLITLTTLLAATMLAQRPGPRNGGGTPPDPATMAQHQVERLTTLLSLTTAQASQATTIFTNAATANAALQTNLGMDRTALQAAIKSNAASTIDQLSTAIGALQGQILSVQSKADAAFYAILTSDQQTKLDSLGGFGRGGFGPGPGGPPPRG
ncbi:MAG TPA: Spy/CpxP family protein refolding chaperone [Bryobacteraceae bacterium]